MVFNRKLNQLVSKSKFDTDFHAINTRVANRTSSILLDKMRIVFKRYHPICLVCDSDAYYLWPLVNFRHLPCLFAFKYFRS